MAERPRELLDSTLFLLVRLGSSVKARSCEELERAGFSLYDYSILALLDEGARETQAAVADALELDRGQLVGLLDTLEQQGLIERNRDTHDRRRHVVSLTSTGRRRLTKLRAVVRELESEVLAPLDDDRRAALHRLLLELAESDDSGIATGSCER